MRSSALGRAAGRDGLFVEKRGVEVGEVLQLEPGNLLSDKPLDRSYSIQLLSRHQGESISDILRGGQCAQSYARSLRGVGAHRS